MSDNEKRAHDFSIALAIELMRPEYIASSHAQTGENEVRVDPYAKYKEIYDMVLPLFNRDFPAGK